LTTRADARRRKRELDTPQSLAERIRLGEQTAVARGISWCELGGDRATALLGLLPDQTAHVVGLTGPPGAGKSTLARALARAHREQGGRIAIVAVDPTSAISGGALLGDRVRLDGYGAGDAGVFFRSLASRGASGGLSYAARGAICVLSAAGFDLVLLETVGAGQSETSIMHVADTVCVVLIPGAGDELQALKAGIMEIADVFVVNKADLPGTETLRRQILMLLQTQDRREGWRPTVVKTVASRGEGVEQILNSVSMHRDANVSIDNRRRPAALREKVEAVVHRSIADGLAYVEDDREYGGEDDAVAVNRIIEFVVEDLHRRLRTDSAVRTVRDGASGLPRGPGDGDQLFLETRERDAGTEV
jgi:LAO/AO transport system kinase